MASIAICADEMAFAGEARLESQPEGRAAIAELDDIDELMRVHQARIRRFALFSTGDADLADTITQDTLLRAYRAREHFRGDCSVSTWITGIAINVTRDHLRSMRFRFWKQVQTTGVDATEMASMLPSGGSSAEQTLLARERVEKLWKVLETLSERQRTIFMMKFSEEIPIEEIAVVLGMKSTTVRTHLHRALKTVRSRLGAAQ